MGALFTGFTLVAGISMVLSTPLYMDYKVQEDYVPILGYHKIRDYTDSLTITIEDYKDQVDYLSNTVGCNWMTMTDLGAYVANEEKLPTNTCIVNFDDGTIDHYDTGLCVLNEHEVPSTYYIAPNNLGTSGYYMTEDNVQALFDRGHDIAAHTLVHARLSDLSLSDQETEILGSKSVLEDMGYPVTTFAYPFGAYNDDTLEILRNSDYVLTRDTSQDNSWKDVRAPLVSFNSDNILHYFYIKPEGLSGSELWDIIKYTGWWQFEGEYLLVNDADGDIRIRSSEIYIATDTSYAVLSMYDTGDEISAKFMTKYSGGFTIDLFLYTSSVNGGFEVKVDGGTYTPTSFEPTDPGYLQATSSGAFSFSNYYVNIPSLSPGVHVLSVVLTEDVTIHLDKFRVFSDTNQDFSDPSSYNSCTPGVDEYCTCDTGIEATPSPIAPSDPDEDCSLGIAVGNICLNPNCQTIGVGCGQDILGGTQCCSGPIIASQRSCSLVGFPCIITPATPAPVAPTDPDPSCSLGIQKDNICCLASCGTCGGTGCALRPGKSGCCGGPIAASGKLCSETGSPCLMSDPTPAPGGVVTDAPVEDFPDPNCETGYLKDNVCYDILCEFYGGLGCGSGTVLGGESCCEGIISSSGRDCNLVSPPCIVSSEGTVSTLSPTPETASDSGCENGIISGDICCRSDCEICTNNGCGNTANGSPGSSFCCASQIRNSGVFCNSGTAPCIISL